MYKEEEIKKCFNDFYHTEFIELFSKKNNIIVVRGTNMWQPELIYEISKIIGGNAYKICYEKHTWTAYFQKRKKTFDEIAEEMNKKQ